MDPAVLSWKRFPLPGIRCIRFEDSDDCRDRIPITRGHGHAHEFFDLAQIADCAHVPAVQTERKSVLDCDESQKPVVRGQTKGQVGQYAGALRHHAHELNDVRAGRLTSEWIRSGRGNYFTPAANHDLGFKWQPAKQFGAQVCLTGGVADHKGSGRADIDDVTVLQLLRKDAWPKGLMPADVHAPQKNDLRHRLTTPSSPL
jgi:hypothetical protein